MNRPIASPSKMRALRTAGWQIETIPGNRLRWTSPSGEAIISGRHVRDTRALKNHAARLKRAAQPHFRAYN